MPIYPYSFQLPPLNVQDIPNDGAPGEFLGINVGGALDWLPAGGGGSGDMLAANNLSELTNFATARTNIGLGTASTPTFANLTLTSPSLASSAPVTISQTWGTTGTYTAFKVVANETAVANTASNLLELWAGSTPTLNFRVNKSGVAQFGPTSSRAVLFDANGGIGINRADNSLTTALVFLGQNTAPRITIVRDGTIGWSQSQFDVSGGNATPDTVLLRDGAANTLALRNGALAQTFNVYGTYSSITDYKRLSLSCSASTGNATIAAPFNSVLAITGGSSNLSIAIISFAAQAAAPPIGSTVVVAGVTPAGYNGIYTVTASTTTSVTYANTTNAPWVSGGTATLSSSGALTLTGAGYLGIQATSPIARLHVGTNGTGVNIGAVFYNENPTIGNAVGVGFVNESSGFNHFKAAIVHERTASWARGKLHFLLNNLEGGGTPSLSDARMTIDPAGNVGIGTTSPTSKLHVEGDSSPTLTIKNTSATGYSQVLLSNTVVPGSGFWVNGSAQANYGGASSFNIYAAASNIAFHTASVTNALSIAQNGTSTHAGQLIFAPDNTYDIGASGANRPRIIYAGSSFQSGSGNAGGLYIGAFGGVTSFSNGVFTWWNNTVNNFDRFQLGGTNDAFPAIARDGAGIKFTGAAAGSTAWIKVPPVAVSALPLAATAGAGARAFVNDALAPTFGSAVTGGGAVLVPVYSTGSAWHVG